MQDPVNYALHPELTDFEQNARRAEEAERARQAQPAQSAQRSQTAKKGKGKPKRRGFYFQGF